MSVIERICVWGAPRTCAYKYIHMYVEIPPLPFIFPLPIPLKSSTILLLVVVCSKLGKIQTCCVAWVKSKRPGDAVPCYMWWDLMHCGLYGWKSDIYYALGRQHWSYPCQVGNLKRRKFFYFKTLITQEQEIVESWNLVSMELR